MQTMRREPHPAAETLAAVGVPPTWHAHCYCGVVKAKEMGAEADSRRRQAGDAAAAELGCASKIFLDFQKNSVNFVALSRVFISVAERPSGVTKEMP